MAIATMKLHLLVKQKHEQQKRNRAEFEPVTGYFFHNKYLLNSLNQEI